MCFVFIIFTIDQQKMKPIKRISQKSVKEDTSSPIIKRIRKSKNISSTSNSSKDFVFFFRPDEPNGWLSNWSNHPISDTTGTTYPTVEHLIMARKASLMDDSASLEKILKTKSARTAKSLGRKVSNWDEMKWQSRREAIALEGLQLKVVQHEEVADLLKTTTPKTLVEASPYDKIWGIGLASTHVNATQPEKWKGSNLLGKLWMKVRDEALKKAEG
jgi:ribA/ribD-fused uncharacterized protein